MGSQLAASILTLHEHYGTVTLPEPRTPFALIVWENCAYLVNDERRAQTFEQLSTTIGIGPAQLLKAGAKRIESAIAGGGMQSAHRADKVRTCAEIAAALCDGDLDAALVGSEPKKRRTLLKRFPGIADPGADKILLLCGLSHAPTVDSNGLRVLERLHAVQSGRTYTQAYRAAVIALENERIVGPRAVEAFAILRAHGRELCKRSSPLCSVCPLRRVCPFAGAAGSS